MPEINGKFYSDEEVRDIHLWHEREIWREDVKTALSLISDDDVELAGYIAPRRERLIEELAPDIPDHLNAIRECAAMNGLCLHYIVEESVRNRMEEEYGARTEGVRQP